METVGSVTLGVGENVPVGMRGGVGSLVANTVAALRGSFCSFPQWPWGGNRSSVLPPVCLPDPIQRVPLNPLLGPEVSPWQGHQGRCSLRSRPRVGNLMGHSGGGAGLDRLPSRGAVSSPRAGGPWGPELDQSSSRPGRDTPLWAQLDLGRGSCGMVCKRRWVRAGRRG